MSIGIKDQYFGCEIEMTGITRQQAAQVLADLFQSRWSHYGSYDGYHVRDREGKVWNLVRDGSIRPTMDVYGRQVSADNEYKVEMNTPKLEYGEMEKLQAVVCALRRAGAVVNDSCGMHVHVDAANHTAQSIKNALAIMYSKEDILFQALKVQEERVDSYCQKVEESTLKKARRLSSNASMKQMEDVWYAGYRQSRTDHYHSSRYHALNVHAVFSHGTLEFRLFESTLDEREVRANIVLALAISAQAITQKRAVMRKTPITENPAFTFRTFLLRLGLIGPEYKEVREHLLKNLPGDKAWRYDRNQYPCNQAPRRHRDGETR